MGSVTRTTTEYSKTNHEIASAASVKKLVVENHQYSYQKVWVSTSGRYIEYEYLNFYCWSYGSFCYTRIHIITYT